VRIAGAPISWGVCEVPGWGHQLRPDRVLAEMGEVGIAATEFGPDGFLPDAPSAKARTLADHGLGAVGGFVPVVLHDPAVDPTPVVDAALDGFVAAGADVLVLAADSGPGGYDQRPALDDADWALVLRRLDALATRAAARGIRPTLHPHVGTVVEGADDVARVLDGCDVPLCLDTGHLLVGGVDPVLLAAEAAARVAHVHLKDVDAALAEAVREGRTPYGEAVRRGLFRPLGAGDVDIASMLDALARAGYDGWYVLEQDVMLDAEPPPGEGPRHDVAASLAFLRTHLEVPA